MKVKILKNGVFEDMELFEGRTVKELEMKKLYFPKLDLEEMKLYPANMQTYAEDLVDRGWKIFPCKPNSKEPACKWKEEMGYDTSFWIDHPDYNIGIPCMENYIVVIDIDGNKGYREWDDLGDKLGYPSGANGKKTFGVRTGKGWHLYYRVQSEFYQGKLSEHIDIKFNGYVLGPGSQHPKGKKYEIYSDNPIQKLPNIWEERIQKKPPKKLKDVDIVKGDITLLYMEVTDKRLSKIESGEAWAQCPFHKNGEEKTPSLSMNYETGAWYCFACQEGGGAHQFLAKVQGIPLPLSDIDYMKINNELQNMRIILN